MSSQLTQQRAPTDAYLPEALHLPTGPIVVATDGAPESDSAVVAAQLYASRTAAPVRVVAALEPLVIQTFDIATLPADPAMLGPRRSMLREEIHDQLRRLVPRDADYPVTITDGVAPQVIAHAAHASHARLLVLGRGRHGLIDRLMEGETVLRVLQLADVPVLAAEPGASELPKRVIIATDFSPYSIYAARVALSLVDPDATVYVVHVTRSKEPLQSELHKVTQAIGAEAMTVHTVVLRGDPGRELVNFASRANVDLVVSGTHGYGFFNRLVLGSVATCLVRGAPCSVLVVPGSALARAMSRMHLGDGQTRGVPFHDWPHALLDFTRRNSGRNCFVEIDDPDLGAQLQGNALPLIGASYDRHGNEVQLMFGMRGLASRYLTHVVPDAAGVEVLTDQDGRDHALRVSNDGGSTLITFID
ncbi:MAG TPA: universal stress protein [Gemmatimonadaceae bacterium]|jgi:Universal stress protein UspA and related nucleotide-binding proteins